MSKTKATHQDDTDFDGPVETGSTKRKLDKNQGDMNADTSVAAPVTTFPAGKVAEDEIMALFAGVEGLSEDFAPKAATLFEGAVSARVAEIRGQLDEEYNTRIEEAYETLAEDFGAKLDAYINYVVEQYMEENQLAIETGIKVEFAEQIVKSAVAIVESAGVSIPDEQIEIVEAAQAEIATVEADLNEALERNRELTGELRKFQIKEALAELSVGLTDAGRDRLRKLTESIMDVSDVADFKARASILKESLTEKTPSAEPLNEEVIGEVVNTPKISPAMQAYLATARGDLK